MMFSFLQQIFRPPLDHYDVIIHLKPEMNPFQHEAVDAVVGKKNKQLTPHRQKSVEKIPVVGFNPVFHYVQELRVS